MSALNCSLCTVRPYKRFDGIDSEKIHFYLTHMIHITHNSITNTEIETYSRMMLKFPEQKIEMRAKEKKKNSKRVHMANR